jgi:hypothetical protein
MAGYGWARLGFARQIKAWKKEQVNACSFLFIKFLSHGKSLKIVEPSGCKPVDRPGRKTPGKHQPRPRPTLANAQAPIVA